MGTGRRDAKASQKICYYNKNILILNLFILSISELSTSFFTNCYVINIKLSLGKHNNRDGKIGDGSSSPGEKSSSNDWRSVGYSSQVWAIFKVYPLNAIKWPTALKSHKGLLQGIGSRSKTPGLKPADFRPQGFRVAGPRSGPGSWTPGILRRTCSVNI